MAMSKQSAGEDAASTGTGESPFRPNMTGRSVPCRAASNPVGPGSGCLFLLSGYQTDELSGTRVGVARLIYYRRIGSTIPKLLEAPIYVGASLEYGNAWRDSSDVSFSSAQIANAIFAGLDSPIGPIYIGAGWAESGANALYLQVGRPF